MTRPLFLTIAVFFCAHPLVAQSTIFLVRHAEKAQSGDTKDPDLSAIGLARAKTLAAVVKDVGITAIFVTEFKRTQQTAEPLAQLTKIPATIVPAKENSALLAKLKEAKGSVLVVGHSNTIPEIIRAVGIEKAVTINETDYDDLFVIRTDEKPPTLLHLHYR